MNVGDLNRAAADGIERVLCAIAKAPVRIALALLFGARIVGGAAVALAEGWRYWDALWFGLVTETTTGYGEFAPETTLGRFATEWLLMWPSVVGLLILTGAIGAAIFQRRIEGHLGTEELDDDFDDLLERVEALKRRYVQKHLAGGDKFLAETPKEGGSS